MSESHSTQPVRAVAYFRKSNEDGGESVEQQRKWAHEACPREGIELVREFTDQAKKGHDTAGRTDFLAMLRFCHQEAQLGRPLDAVVCWNPNRFSRSDSLETAKFLCELRDAGVNHMFTANGWLDFRCEDHRGLFNLSQDMDRHRYVKQLAQDATRGRIAAAQDGRWNGGKPPYGYRVIYCDVVVRGKRKRRPEKLVPGDPAEVEIVKWLFHTYAYTDISLRGLVNELRRRGVRSPTGGELWGGGTLHKLLMNRAYLGEMIWNRRHMGKFFGVVNCEVETSEKKKERMGPDKKRQWSVANDEKEWISRQDRHEPLIDVATFERCQLKMTERKTMTAPKRGYQFLLSGLLFCGRCRRRMVGRTLKVFKKRTGKSHVYRKYCCGGYNTYGKNVCGYNIMDEDQLLGAIARKVQETFLDPANLQALRDKIRA
jgi:DNA invertase Pin-like site-specific DNA recombinase